MCSIGGILNLAGNPIPPQWLRSMNQSMRHRGPDDEGYVMISNETGEARTFSGVESSSSIRRSYPLLDVEPSAGEDLGLAHRRFTIIDLTDGGHQPLFDHGNRCCVVSNGEIYNYLELREQLQQMGHTFRTDSDTEIIVEAYKAWGSDCFSKLIGMWAIALYDFQQKRLLISRDHLGKKPLYWVKHEHWFAFASEIKALLLLPFVEKRKAVNEQAVFPYLVHGHRDLDNSTFFRDIHSFPSASWAAVGPDFPNGIQTYWSIPKQRLSERDIGIDQACTQINTLLDDAVRIRLRSDVPWCATLSGGMDSSAVVAKAAKFANEQITTFTLRFPEKKYNEEPFARAVAERYQTDQHVVDSPEGNLWRDIREFTYLNEEPYHAPNVYTNLMLRIMIRGTGRKVALDGAAGDELFAGYPRYFHAAQLAALGKGKLGYYFRNGLNWTQQRNKRDGLLKPLNYLLSTIRRRIKGAGNATFSTHIHAPASQHRNLPLSLPTALYTDQTNTIIPYWLRSGDKVQMGIPLEMRKPYLDYRMVEFAASLPETYLIRNGWHKWILRKALENELPHEVVWRKQKMGGPFPIESFFKKSKSILQLIAKESSNPYCDFFDCLPDHTMQWRIVSFLLWYELFFNQNEELFLEIGKRCTFDPSVAASYEPEYLRSARQEIGS